MLQSKLFPKTLREDPKDESSVNARLLIRAGYIDKLMAGVYTFLPLGLRVLENIKKVIRDEMISAGGQEVLMPSLQPKENWEKTGRWNSLDCLFRFVSYYSKIDYALGPTHEEVVVPLAGRSPLSYKDLPMSLFQIQSKFRDEKRAKSGILRGREFVMKDLYSFHTDEKDMDEYYEKMKTVYKNVFDKCGIGEKTFLTFASGGSFSKFSHEFQTLTDAGEDVIYICNKCGTGHNREVFDDNLVEKGKCVECGSTDLREEKAVETGNIFKLKTKYSEPFNLQFTDANGEKKTVMMGCYGIGLTRLMGTVVEVLHDEKGIMWPKSIAPFAVHLVKIKKSKEKDAVDAFCDELYGDLQKAGIEVLYDDRMDVGAGEKFADSDLIGIPTRVVVSEKTLASGKIEVKRRNEKEPFFAENKEELLKYV